MRLFHVSEESTIQTFEPRLPSRDDLDPDTGLVWAIDEPHLPNFLTPRNCPRVTYHSGPSTTEEDKRKFFSSATQSHVVIIESQWFPIMSNTQLYLYEFAPEGFELLDSVAGYYVSKTAQTPMAKFCLDNLFQELFSRNVEVRIVDNLWDIGDEVAKSTLNWSLCRMGMAQPRGSSKQSGKH